MSSVWQIEANRRNARRSTGPITEAGKRLSRQNAVHHGLSAETLIDVLEDAEDYAAFEMAITADYDAQSAVERELVLRLASLLWRLRRATAIESGLFKIQARQLLQFRQSRQAHQRRQEMIDSMYRNTVDDDNVIEQSKTEVTASLDADSLSRPEPSEPSDDLTMSFVRLCNLPTFPLDRLARYEGTLWRQACQILFTLQSVGRGKPWERVRYR